MSLKFVCVLICVCVASVPAVFGQAAPGQSTLGSFTPKGLEPGSPAGAYALSGLDTVNLYNGVANIAVPLLQVGGRGEAGYMIQANVTKKPWNEYEGFSYICCGDSANPWNYTYQHAYAAGGGPSAFFDIRYKPAVIFARQAVNIGFLDCGVPSGTLLVTYWSITRLTVLMADGSEIELSDQATMGQYYGGPSERNYCITPQPPHYSRGPTWVSTDGSTAVFVADTTIADEFTAETFFGVTGTLYFRDGRQFRFKNGYPTWIRDRNGNQTNFDYTPSGVNTVDDPNNYYALPPNFFDVIDTIGRRTRIRIGNPNPEGEGSLDTITSPAGRVIKVYNRPYENDCFDCGGSAPTEYSLFPLQGSFTPVLYAGTYKIEIPSGQTYRFRYNKYAEIVRMIVPTGGVVEYDWQSAGPGGGAEVLGSTINPYSGLRQVAILRRVSARREYAGSSAPAALDTYPAANSTRTTRYTYTQLSGATGIYDPFDSAYDPGALRYRCSNATVPLTGTTTAANYCTRTDVQEEDSAGAVLRYEQHYFYGSATNPATLFPVDKSYSAWMEGKEFRTTTLPAANGSALRDERQTWQQRANAPWWSASSFDPPPAGDPRLTQADRVIDGGKMARKQFVYTADNANNVADLYEYDYGNAFGSVGTFLRRKHTDYVTNNNNPLAGVHLRNLPSLDAIYDGSNSPVAQTAYEYDIYSGPSHAALVPRSSIVGMASGYTTSYTTRGNVTGIARWITGDTWATSYQQYDVAGNVVTEIDPRNKPTALAYDDRYGVPSGNARTNTPPAELGAAMSFALPTLITNAVGETVYTKYDYYLSKPVDQEEPNGVVSSFAYNDPLDRPTQWIRSANVTADKSQTSFSYDDAGHTITKQSDLNSYGDNVLKSQSVYDGLGRTIETRQYESVNAYISTLRTYDALERVNNVSNPYRPASESVVWTTTEYDALDRVKKVTLAGGAPIITDYVGDVVTVMDPATKVRRHILDAFGRTTQVTEDPSGLNYVTSYCYGSWPTAINACIPGLDNLAHVSQGAQSRTFLYDGLSHLTDAINPETGIVSYQYDAAGNLTQKTDNRGTVTTYIYDDVNRLRNRNYTVAGETAPTPNVTYTFGATSSACGSYSKGRLCSVVSTTTTNSYSYNNARGLVTQSNQTTADQTYTFNNYIYNRADGLISMTYPSGRILNYTMDAAGRIGSVWKQGGNYYAGDAATPIQYAPHGAIQQMKLGNGLWEESRFNARLQPLWIGLGASSTALTSAALNTTNSNMLLLEYGYGSTNNNGNVISQTIRIGATTLTQSYSYDGVNRLETANETSSGTPWLQTYGHDLYGNHWVSAGANYGNTPALTPTLQLHFNPTNNRLNMLPGDYDAAGNLKTDPTGRTFTYDAENRQISYIAGVASLNATYEYDGDGRRVKKLQNGVTTVFVYDAQGRLAAEYSTQPSTDSSGTRYLTADHLGSTRIATNASGAVLTRHDYLPFGDEIASGLGARSAIAGYSDITTLRQKFTGKERDQETGFDHFEFRYLSSAQGRFTSPDPENAGVRLADPQTWNAYSYVRNLPVRLVDPHGLDTCYLEGVETNCGQVFSFVSSGAAVQCPNNICTRYSYDQGQFQRFIAGAGGAAGYVNFSDLGEINEWQGRFLNNAEFYQMQVSQSAFQQQLKLEITRLATYLNISVDAAAKLIITNTDLTVAGHPELHGGNWNFWYDPFDAVKYTTLAVNARVPGSPSLHLHLGEDVAGPFSHVDTADPRAASGSLSVGGLLQHFFVDLLLGNTIYTSTGIPRP